MVGVSGVCADTGACANAGACAAAIRATAARTGSRKRAERTMRIKSLMILAQSQSECLAPLSGLGRADSASPGDEQRAEVAGDGESHQEALKEIHDVRGKTKSQVECARSKGQGHAKHAYGQQDAGTAAAGFEGREAHS